MRSTPRFTTLAPFACACVCAVGASTASCEAPFITKDGQLTFPQRGAHGAAVMGQNGVEFHDRDEIPRPVVVRDVDEPFRTPIGFILPASGVFTKTATPVVKTAEGVALVVRPSDTRVPSWGGEILVRVDVHAVSNEGTRPALDVAIILEGIGEDTGAIVESALARLGSKDNVTIIDARGPRVVVPTIPATHRALALAAIAQRISSTSRARPLDLATAVGAAQGALGASGSVRDRRLLLVTATELDAVPKLTTAARDALTAIGRSGVKMGAIAAATGVDDEALRARVGVDGVVVGATADPRERIASLARVLPPSGPMLFRDVTLDAEGVPAPTHILETSGPEPTWTLDGGSLPMGDLASGVLSAEVLRVSVPPWVAGGSFNLTLTVRARDATTGALRTLRADLAMTYDDDIERIAESRAGDVIAYASALGTMDRLQAAFIGSDVTKVGGLRQLAELQVRSLSLLARDFPDRGFAEDAAVLDAMLAAGR